MYCNSSYFYAAKDKEKALKMGQETVKLNNSSPLKFKEVNCSSCILTQSN